MENSQVLEHIGKTYTEKLKDEIQSEYFEIMIKDFPKIQPNAIKPRNCCLVTALEEKEIIKIGLNCMNDLIVDMYGFFLASMFSAGNGTWSGFDLGGSNFNFRYNSSGASTWNKITGGGANVLGTGMQFGDSSIPATRTDFKLGNALGSLTVTDGAYNIGLAKVAFNGSVSPLGFNGIVKEIGCNATWRTDIFGGGSGTFKTVLITHEIISPEVPFSIGQALNVDYGFVFS